MRASLLFVCCLLMMGTAHATRIDTPLATPAHEQTARAIFHELRCVTCEGQTIADSNAALATQMRAHVRQMVAEGKTYDEVLAYFKERYGEAILMTPALAQTTALLWLGPLFILVLGAALVWRSTKHTKDDIA